MKKKIADSAEREIDDMGRERPGFDWWLFSFITFVIILLVVLLSYQWL